jgi:hypothetical protein
MDTTPGSGGTMAPGPEFNGTGDQYRDVVRERFRRDPEARQCMLIAARRFDPDPERSPVAFHGRYAELARALIARLAEQLRRERTEH